MSDFIEMSLTACECQTSCLHDLPSSSAAAHENIIATPGAGAIWDRLVILDQQSRIRLHKSHFSGRWIYYGMNYLGDLLHGLNLLRLD